MSAKKIYRTIFYIVGMIVLAAGITLNTKTNLGVSPVVSVPYTFSQVTGMNFGDATFILYCIFIAIQIIIHVKMNRKKQIPFDLLQIIVSLIFTRFMNLFSAAIPDLVKDLPGTFWCTIPGRLVGLAAAIILTGVGAALSLNARIVPNPGDGITQAFSDFLKKPVGLMKNGLDLICVCIGALAGMLCQGHLFGIGIGTICAMIGTGRVIAVFNHFTMRPIQKLSGLDKN